MYIDYSFNRTSVIRLHTLTCKFNSYKMHLNQTMKQYFRIISTMIHLLKATKNNLIDEQ